MRRILIADLHLDPHAPELITLFERFCVEVAATADEFWILGDLFECWVGDDAEDAAAAGVRTQLARLNTQGTRCQIMHGNRDFLIGADFADLCRADLCPDPTVIQCGARTVVLTHGDALCTDDLAYQQLRTQLRSDTWRDALLAKPLAERQALGMQARRHSRATNALKPESIMDVNQQAVDTLLDQFGADLLVHGHTHRPGQHHWTRNGQDRYRCVLGAWDQGSVCYAHIDATGTAELMHWS